MSLGGTQRNPPMGLYDYLMDPAYDSEVSWLLRLATMRSYVNDWFIRGRAVRDPPISIQTTSYTATDRKPPIASSSKCPHSRPDPLHPINTPSSVTPCLSADPVAPALISAWLISESSRGPASLLITLVTPATNITLNAAFTINVIDFGIIVRDTRAMYNLFSIQADGSRLSLGTYKWNAISWNQNGITGRNIVALVITASQTAVEATSRVQESITVAS